MNVRVLQAVGGMVIVIMILAFIDSALPNWEGKADLYAAIVWTVVLTCILLMGAAAVKILLKK